MTYTQEDSAKLSSECKKILGDLQILMGECGRQGYAAPNERAQEYMLHGAARRVLVLLRSVENIFSLFPPTLERPLNHEELSDVQINLHAFMINLYGVWDNWAWAFVHRHGLLSAISDYRNVGLFNQKTQKFLPSILKEYLVAETMVSWHTKYLKEYRDALAHRIPLYIPPANFTPEEWEQYKRLEDEKWGCIKSMRWKRLDALWAEQENIGRPWFAFLHSSSKEEGSNSIALHTQILCDAMLVVKFGTMFLGAWHERAYPPHRS